MKTQKLFTLLAIIFSLITSAVYSQTATWNGNFDEDWNNAANWTWSDGSTGIPNTNTDVFIPDSTSNEPAILTIGSCKNLTFVYIDWGPILYLVNNATINIYGNVTTIGTLDEGGEIYSIDTFTGDFTNTTTVNFYGVTDQSIETAIIIAGNININSSNVSVDTNAVFMIIDTLRFNVAPVSLGADADGCLLINKGGFIFNPLKVQLPTYTDLQTPPHIVTLNTSPETPSDAFGLAIAGNITDVGLDGISGNLTFDIGASTKSYNPVTIQSTEENVWIANVNKADLLSCAPAGLAADKVENTYFVGHFDIMTGDLLTTLSSPATITFSYQENTAVEDITTGFNPSSLPVNVWRRNAMGATPCYNMLPGATSSLTGTLNKIAQPNVTTLGNFNLSPFADAVIVDSIVVSVIGGIPAVINNVDDSLSLQAVVYPTSIPSTVNWSIVPITGNGIIDASGVAKGTTAGTFYAKATSTADPSMSDSILITYYGYPSSINNPTRNELGIEMYPNPVSKVLHLKITKMHPSLSVKITDLTGKIIRDYNYGVNQLNEKQSINIEEIASGIYFIQLNGDNINYTTKFIKQ